MKNRIEIVEDNDVVRDGMQLLINSMSDHVVVGAYISCEQALKNLDRDMPEIIARCCTNSPDSIVTHIPGIITDTLETVPLATIVFTKPYT